MVKFCAPNLNNAKPAGSTTLMALYTWASGRIVNGHEQVCRGEHSLYGYAYYLTYEYRITLVSNKLVVQQRTCIPASREFALTALSKAAKTTQGFDQMFSYIKQGREQKIRDVVTDYSSYPNEEVPQLMEYVDDPVVMYCLYKIFAKRAEKNPDFEHPFRTFEQICFPPGTHTAPDNKAYVMGLITARERSNEMAERVMWPLFHIWGVESLAYKKSHSGEWKKLTYQEDGSDLEVGNSDWGYTARWTWYDVEKLFEPEVPSNGFPEDSDEESEDETSEGQVLVTDDWGTNIVKIPEEEFKKFHIDRIPEGPTKLPVSKGALKIMSEVFKRGEWSACFLSRFVLNLDLHLELCLLARKFGFVEGVSEVDPDFVSKISCLTEEELPGALRVCVDKEEVDVFVKKHLELF